MVGIPWDKSSKVWDIVTHSAFISSAGKNVSIVLYISVEVLPYNHSSHSQLQILEQGMDSRSFQAYSASVMVDGPFMQANFASKFLWLCYQGVNNAIW